MCADYRVYTHISRRSHAVVASACALLAYTGAHQVENIYKDELYLIHFRHLPKSIYMGTYFVVKEQFTIPDVEIHSANKVAGLP